MRVDPNKLIATYNLSPKKSDTSSDMPFLLGDDEQEAQTEPSSIETGTSTSSQASANVSAALWHISDPGGLSASTSSVEISVEGTARIQAMLSGSSDDLLDQFLALSRETPAERIRTEYLNEHYLTENSFKELPIDQQNEIDKMIAERIKQQLGLDDGVNAASADSHRILR
ncbi:hypothetical protein HRR99_07130 [Agrobacterium vaccinii]|uniref:hypothetical protein n=1 Tax=Agrobacterium vaccinii TaxID=2735528 RepID=UPI001E5ECFEE|nr:hypothetical protein [Agrobacterium vaccinii]UHS61301.1 hypothetical protein HRR99_07130 [Agrobacterium vaccinii]